MCAGERSGRVSRNTVDTRKAAGLALHRRTAPLITSKRQRAAQKQAFCAKASATEPAGSRPKDSMRSTTGAIRPVPEDVRAPFHQPNADCKVIVPDAMSRVVCTLATSVLDRRIVIVGSPSYFERAPGPRKPDDLFAHKCVCFVSAPVTSTPGNLKRTNVKFKSGWKGMLFSTVAIEVPMSTESRTDLLFINRCLAYVDDHARRRAPMPPSPYRPRFTRSSLITMAAVPTSHQLAQLDDRQLDASALDWLIRAARGENDAFGTAHALEIEQRARLRTARMVGSAQAVIRSVVG
jgi:hypothetical protein